MTSLLRPSGARVTGAATDSECERDTRIIDDKFTYDWAIDSEPPSSSAYRDYDSESRKHCSPTIPRRGRLWQLFVKPSRKARDDSDYDYYSPRSQRRHDFKFDVGLRLLSKPSSVTGTQVQMTCSILADDGSGRKLQTTQSPVTNILPEKTEITRSLEIGNRLRTSFTFLFEVVVYVPPNPLLYSSSVVRTHLASIREEGLFTDFTLVAEGKEFGVHKVVLAASSPVFRRMIESPMRESKEARVTIDDFSAKVVEEMLTFIYSGNAPNLHKMTMKLLAIADKYQIEDLKVSCGKELDRHLSVHNAAKTLILADTHNVQPLKLACVKFIAVHYSDIKETPELATLMKQHQQAYILILEELATADIGPPKMQSESKEDNCPDEPNPPRPASSPALRSRPWPAALLRHRLNTAGVWFLEEQVDSD